MQKYLLLLIGALFLSACNSNQQQNLTTDSLDTLNTIAVIDRTPKTFKGLFVINPEGNTFQDCDNQHIYWITDSTSQLRTKYEDAIKPLPYSKERAYAEVTGYLDGKAKSGMATDYDNVLVVTKIDRIEAKNFRTECYQYEFIALGTEPFWSLDIMPNEQRIILKDLSQNKSFEFPYEPANIGGGVYRFESKNSSKDKLVVVIRKENCSDGMSDNTYNYSAEVVINSRTLKGCAVKKGDIK